MKKLALFLLILTVIIIGVSFVLDRCNREVEAPASVNAKFIVRTGSVEGDGYYYTDSYDEGVSKIHGKYVVLHGYWEYHKSAWVYRPGDLPLYYSAYPNLVVRLR